jgi:hypothetical protein
MLSSNMLLLILIPLIGVTFSTPTGDCTSVRFSFAFFRPNECNGDITSTMNGGVFSSARQAH